MQDRVRREQRLVIKQDAIAATIGRVRRVVRRRGMIGARRRMRAIVAHHAHHTRHVLHGRVHGHDTRYEGRHDNERHG